MHWILGYRAGKKKRDISDILRETYFKSQPPKLKDSGKLQTKHAIVQKCYDQDMKQTKLWHNFE